MENVGSGLKNSSIVSNFHERGLNPSVFVSSGDNAPVNEEVMDEADGLFDDGVFKDIQISPIRTLNFNDEDIKDLDSLERDVVESIRGDDDEDDLNDFGMQADIGNLEV
ncbi:hypothetical protein SUGI_0624040 [Cryptomeria japonica]|nr:hypothetical protein SUGI_0624040 [Cryptomeria japonica]